MSYSPVGIMSDCENGYGVALVQDGDNPSVRADVDLNTTDGSAAPRIRVAGNWINVDDAFVSAYRGMTPTNSMSADSRTEACGAIRSAVDPGISEVHPFWLVTVPTLAVGGGYAVNRIARADLLTASSDPGTVGSILDWSYGGANALYSATLTPMTRHSDRGWAYGMGGVNAGAGLAFLIASFAQPSGRGTPELSTSLSLLTNGGLVFVYGDRVSGRDPVRFYTGFGLQLALGATGLGLGLGGVGRRPTVSEPDMYAPDGMAGARGVPGNPYEGMRFPGLDRDLVWLGAGHILGAGLNLVDYLWISRAGENRPEEAPRVHVGFSPLPGGGVGSVSGSF